MKANVRTKPHARTAGRTAVHAGRALASDLAPAVRSEAPAPARRTAADLIARQTHWSEIPEPSAEALAELRVVLAHNDAASFGLRVSSDKTIEMLRGYGWAGKTRQALNALCRRVLGRSSFGAA